MRITQWAEYGIQSTVFIADQHAKGIQTVGAAEIAEVLHFSVEYAQQILQRLRKGNIIESVRGPQGGYRLARSPSEITMKDILIATEGDTFEIICETKPLDIERCSPDHFCGLRDIWHEMKDHLNTFCKAYTLERLQAKCAPSHAQDIPVQLPSRTQIS